MAVADTPSFSCTDFALLRTPAQSVRHVEATFTGPSPGCADEVGRSVEYLRALAADPLLREAVEVSSPPLAARWEQILRGEKRSPADIRRAVRALSAYRLRMATRCTPFGLMAGVAVARFAERAEDTRIRLGAAHRKTARLERGWVTALVNSWVSRPEVLRHLRLTANNLCRVRGDRLVLSYLPDLDADPAARSRVREISVRYTPVVRTVLEATHRPLPYPELERRLAEQFPAAPDGAIRQVLTDLARREILLTDLRPPAAEPDAAAHVLAVLAAVDPGAVPELAELRAVVRDLADYTARPLGAGRAAWQAATARLDLLRPAQRGVQVDLAVDAEVLLPPQVAAEAERAAGLLWRLAPAGPGSRALVRYHEEFVERFGMGRAVPVTELLDPDAGLGAPAGYRHPAGNRTEPPPPAEVTERDRLMTELAQEALLSGAEEVVLDDRHPLVARYSGTGRRPPGSVELYTQLLAPSVDALRAGAFRLVVTGGSAGPAIATFGRFAYLLPDALRPALAELAGAGAGAAPGALHAQVVFQARHGRGDNVTQVPDWLEHTVPIGVFADPAAPGTLALADLAVRADRHRLLVVDTARGREVVPAVLHKLDTRTLAPNAARLLEEIGRGGLRGVHAWEWGQAAHLPYVPRVRYGRSVLSLAGWRPCEALLDPESPFPVWAATLQAWRERWRVPERIRSVYVDQSLDLDLTRPLHLRLLRHELRRRPSTVLVERLDADGTGTGWLTGPDGPHANELVIPLVVRAPFPPDRPPAAERPALPPPAGRIPAALPSPRRPRSTEHLPGGEWLYAIVRCTPERQDELLVHRLGELVDHLPEQVDRWFFVRHRDPGDHLRLRFHGTPAVLAGTLLPRLHRWAGALREDRLIGGCVLGTYDPELERFGGPEAMTAAERVFHADTLAAVEALRLREAGRLPLEPVLLAATGQAAVARAFWTAYDAADGDQPGWALRVLDAVPRGEMHRAFQECRAQALALIDPFADWQGLRERSGGEELLASWRARSTALADYAHTLRALGDACWTPPAQVLFSLLHLHHNRLVGIDPPAERAAMAILRGALQAHRDRARSRP